MSTRLDELKAKLASDRKLAEITASFNGIHLHSVVPGITREERADAVRHARRLVAEWVGEESTHPPDSAIHRASDSPGDAAEGGDTREPEHLETIAEQPAAERTPLPRSEPASSASESAETIVVPDLAEDAHISPVASDGIGEIPPSPEAPIDSHPERRKSPRTPIVGAARIEKASRLARDDDRHEPTIRALDGVVPVALEPALGSPSTVTSNQPVAATALPPEEKEHSGTSLVAVSVVVLIALLALGGYLFRDRFPGVLALVSTLMQPDGGSESSALSPETSDGRATKEGPPTPESTSTDGTEPAPSNPMEAQTGTAAPSTEASPLAEDTDQVESSAPPTPAPVAAIVPEIAEALEPDQSMREGTAAETRPGLEPESPVTPNPVVDDQPKEAANGTDSGPAPEPGSADDAAVASTETPGATDPASGQSQPERPEVTTDGGDVSENTGDTPKETAEGAVPTSTTESQTSTTTVDSGLAASETISSEAQPAAPSANSNEVGIAGLSEEAASPEIGSVEEARDPVSETITMIVEEPPAVTDAVPTLVSESVRPETPAETQVGTLSGADIRAAQEHLERLGYDVGAADGILGPRTRRAVRAFQRDIGVLPDGEITQNLVARLAATP